MRTAHPLRGVISCAKNRAACAAPDTDDGHGVSGCLFVSGDADGTQAAGHVGSSRCSVYVCFVKKLAHRLGRDWRSRNGCGLRT